LELVGHDKSKFHQVSPSFAETRRNLVKLLFSPRFTKFHQVSVKLGETC